MVGYQLTRTLSEDAGLDIPAACRNLSQTCVQTELWEMDRLQWRTPRIFYRNFTREGGSAQGELTWSSSLVRRYRTLSSLLWRSDQRSHRSPAVSQLSSTKLSIGKTSHILFSPRQVPACGLTTGILRGFLCFSRLVPLIVASKCTVQVKAITLKSRVFEDLLIYALCTFTARSNYLIAVSFVHCY